ncbi:hypothetical protein [Neorhizobium galegae]|uniref:hypothetical protein n=1 Tax=Neorhizobium galegae TaxID=399 RepID=UPI000621FC03|nr:hypothetical protein [Neorhizobium galegae]CDZ49750.1 Hypothetical protein NGAL_HAMBI2427_33190 [Neorhizobium galegae bv. orientalis]
MKQHIFVASILLGLAAFSARAEDAPAAIVADFNAADLIAFRSRTTLQLGTGLAAGETVSISKGGYLKLLVGAECVVIGDAPGDAKGCTVPAPDKYAFTVPENGFVSGMTGRFQRFQKVLSWWDPKTESRVMRSRDGLAAQMPALAEADESFLASGDRELHIQWVDGTAPFRIAILDASGRELAAQSQESDRNATLRIKIENNAIYRLQLESAGNIAATYIIRGKSETPFGPEGKEASILQAMKIVESVSASDGAWALEAAQTFRTLPLDDRLRQALLDAVNFADWP